MSDQPITEKELLKMLKDKLLKEIEAEKPQTTRDFRLLAIRTAERLSTDDGGTVHSDLKNQLYDVFTEMMGIAVQR